MSRRFRHIPGLLRAVLTGLALIGQLALGAVLPGENAAVAQVANAFNAVAIFCMAPQPADHGGKAHRHPAAPAICPASAALAMPSMVITPSSVLPLPAASLLALASKERPPGRGPPPAGARVSAPRAPPYMA
jgi:hypothetical protein